MDADADRRRRWRLWVRASRRAEERREAAHSAMMASGLVSEPGDALPAFPDDLRGLTCGAKTRAGGRCRRRDLADSGRCLLHGGRSTGAKTPEGQARSFANLGLRWPREPMGVQEMTGSEALEAVSLGKVAPPEPSPYRRRRSGLGT